MTNEAVLRGQHLAKSFEQGKVRVEVLVDVSLNVARGDQVAIIGASGSGKSTLLHILGGLDDATGGTVEVAGQNLSALSLAERGWLRNRELGFIYQFHHLLSEFTTVENVAMPLWVRREPTGKSTARARSVLERVGLGHRLEHKPGELSGGERQRAAVARALVTEPSCVLADEPTGNLDRRTAESVLELMLELNQESNASLVVVTHDTKLAERMHRILRLEDGRLLDGGGAAAVG